MDLWKFYLDRLEVVETDKVGLVEVTRNEVLHVFDDKNYAEKGKRSIINRQIELMHHEGIVPGSFKWDNRISALKKSLLCSEYYFEGKAIDLMLNFHNSYPFFSRTSAGVASKSEIRRWFENNSVQIRGRKGIKPDEQVGTFYGLALFPKATIVTLL